MEDEELNNSTEHLYKVLIVGESGVGKTSLIKKYIHNIFSNHYRATIGVDFGLKIIKINDDNHAKLQLWDIAGQERFGNMTRVYYREADAAIIVCDVQDIKKDVIEKWKYDIDDKLDYKIPVVLFINKCDLDATVNEDDITNLCGELNIFNWYLTSVKNGYGYEKGFCDLVEKMFNIQKPHIEEPYTNGIVHIKEKEYVDNDNNCC